MSKESASGLLSLDNPVFANFMFYGGVLIAKTVFMSFWTARHRIANNAMPAPEDYKGARDADTKYKAFCAPVERVRKAHLNDIENIPMFLFAGFFYILTKPDPFTALWHFRVFTAARITHTLGYLNAVTPIRGIGFMGSTAALLSIVGQSIFFAYTAGYY